MVNIACSGGNSKYEFGLSSNSGRLRIIGSWSKDTTCEIYGIGLLFYSDACLRFVLLVLKENVYGIS